LVAAAKFLVEATKKLFVVPNFVAVTKPFFSVYVRRKLVSLTGAGIYGGRSAGRLGRHKSAKVSFPYENCESL